MAKGYESGVRDAIAFVNERYRTSLNLLNWQEVLEWSERDDV